jgi:hypothetical protein
LSYSKAAIQYARGEREVAAKTLAQARAQFGASVEDLFSDSFAEMKWGERDAASGRFGFFPQKK